MFSYILKLKDSKEFFIQKAIGWILRQYSKTHPDEVLRFVHSTELKPLSKREALKIINKL
jgi:3-methyladenine DNA glycosylase AlkD